MGDNAGVAEVEAYARGLLHPDGQQHNRIAQAVNERGAGYPVGYQPDP